MTEKVCLKIQIYDWNGWKRIELNIKYENTEVKDETITVTILSIQKKVLSF